CYRLHLTYPCICAQHRSSTMDSLAKNMPGVNFTIDTSQTTAWWQSAPGIVFIFSLVLFIVLSCVLAWALGFWELVCTFASSASPPIGGGHQLAPVHPSP